MSINADTALETPQILIKWDYKDNPHKISRVIIARSDYRYPESIKEGTVVLDEGFDETKPRTSFADTSVEADKVYYYSVFFRYYGPASMAVRATCDIERLGTIKAIIDDYSFIYRDIVYVGEGTLITLSGTANAPVKPGTFIGEATIDYGGVPIYVLNTDDGNGNIGSAGTINYETGDWYIDFTIPVVAGSNVYLSYGYRINTYWLLTTDQNNEDKIYRYNSAKQLVENEISLSYILQPGEAPVSLAGFTRYDLELFIPSEEFFIVTDHRFIRVSSTDDKLGSIINSWSADTSLNPGYKITGSTIELRYNGSFMYIYGVRLLDNGNKENVLCDFTTGSFLRKIDLSGLSFDNFVGTSFNFDDETLMGTGNLIVATYSVSSSLLEKDMLTVYPLRNKLTCDFACEGDTKITVTDNDNNLLIDYYRENRVDLYQLEDPIIPGKDIIGIWRLNNLPPVDVSGNHFNSTVYGNPSITESGRFGSCIKLNEGDYINLISGLTGFDWTYNVFSFWYKIPYEGYLLGISADKTLFKLGFPPSSNEISLKLSIGNKLKLNAVLGGTSNSIEADAGIISDGLFHNIIAAFHFDGSLKPLIYIDGELISPSVSFSGSGLGANGELLLGDSSDSALGYYDDFSIAIGSNFFDSGSLKIESTPGLMRYNLITRGNRAHAYSGRDPDLVTVNFRNKLASYLGQFINNNDYGKTQLSPNIESSLGDYILRESRDKLNLGHLGALSRLVGLLLDRTVDRRKFFLNHLTADSVEDEFIELLGELIGINDLSDDWNTDKKRRYLEVAVKTRRYGGTLLAYKLLTRFLGFYLYAPEDNLHSIFSRQRLDSCTDPNRLCEPLDSGVFDSFDLDYPLTRLLLSFFKPANKSSGLTSSSSDRKLVDDYGFFNINAEVGSMISIYDPDSSGDNGQYIIESVDSDSTVTIDRDWPSGGLLVDYRVMWRVKSVDPYTDYIINKLNDIRAHWQSLENEFTF